MNGLSGGSQAPSLRGQMLVFLIMNILYGLYNESEKLSFELKCNFLHLWSLTLYFSFFKHCILNDKTAFSVFKQYYTCFEQQVYATGVVVLSSALSFFFFPFHNNSISTQWLVVYLLYFSLFFSCLPIFCCHC